MMFQHRWKVGHSRAKACEYKGVQTPHNAFKVVRKQLPASCNAFGAITERKPPPPPQPDSTQPDRNSGETGTSETPCAAGTETTDTTMDLVSTSSLVKLPAATIIVDSDLEAVLKELEVADGEAAGATEEPRAELKAAVSSTASLEECLAEDDLAHLLQLEPRQHEDESTPSGSSATTNTFDALSSEEAAKLLEDVCMDEDAPPPPSSGWFSGDFDGSTEALGDFFSALGQSAGAATSAAFWMPILAPAHPSNYGHVAQTKNSSDTGSTCGVSSLPAGEGAHALPLHAMPPHAPPPHALPPHALPPHALPPHALPPHALPPPEGTTSERKRKKEQPPRRSRAKARDGGGAPIVFNWLELMPTITHPGLR